MKQKQKFWCAIVAIAVISYSIIACDNGTAPHMHEWGELTQTRAPTCAAPGVGRRVCNTCGDVDSNVAIPSEHNWGAWAVATAPTCTRAGIGVRICSACGVTDPNTSIPPEHKWGAWAVATAPTCTAPGVGIRICTVCNEADTNTTMPALGHEGDWTVKTPATCTSAGEDKRICNREGCTQSQTRRTIGHNFVGGICSICNYSIAMEMVQIPAGTFTMGSPSTEPGRYSDEGPQRQVSLSAFRMGKYEVTQEQYFAVMAVNPSYFHGGTGREAAAEEIQVRRPVESVSWYDAIVFCNKLSIIEGLSPAYNINGSTNPDDWGAVPVGRFDPLRAVWDAVQIISGSTGYRLPTEAQWEYAARAGTSTAYSYGDTANGDYMWFWDNSGSRTHEVGKKLPNPWGLYDMHGNVWEWCWDWWSERYPNEAQTDPTGAVSGSVRVARGGSWNRSAASARSALRDYLESSQYRSEDDGFRVVRP